MPKSFDHVVDHYRDPRVAAKYDKSRYSDLQGRLNNRAERRALCKALTHVAAGGRVLDVPCGTGRFSWALSRLGFKTFASDVSLEMIDIGRYNKTEADVAPPRFFQGDIFRLPFRDGSFAAAVCVRFMNLMGRQHRIAAVRELARTADVLVVSYYHKYTFKYFGRWVRQKLGLRATLSPRLSRRDLLQEIAETGLQIRELVPVFPILSESWMVVLQRLPDRHVGEIRPVASGRIETAANRLVGRAICRFSHTAVWRLGRVLGGLAYHLMRQQRRVALANLDIAFNTTKTPREKERIAQTAFRSFASTELGLLWSPRLNRTVLDEIVEVDRENLEWVRRVYASGRGIIFVTLHYGDWELLGLVTGFYGMPVTIVAEPMKNIALEETLTRLRAQSGHRIVARRRAAPRLMKALRRGEGVAMLIDLNGTPRRGGVWLDFFGLPVFNNAAVGALAFHTGAALITGVAHPLPGGRVRISYGPEIEYSLTGDFDADVRRINQKCLDFCAAVIRERPEYWLWSYKRWKFRPSEKQDGYPHYSRQAWF